MWQETGFNSEFLLLVFLLVPFVRNHSRCAAYEHICLLTVKCSFQVSEAFENRSKDWNLNVCWDLSLCGCPPRPEPAELAGCIYSACVTTNSRPVHHCRVNDALVSRRALPVIYCSVLMTFCKWGLYIKMPSTIMCTYQSYHDNAGRSDWLCFLCSGINSERQHHESLLTTCFSACLDDCVSLGLCFCVCVVLRSQSECTFHKRPCRPRHVWPLNTRELRDLLLWIENRHRILLTVS